MHLTTEVSGHIPLTSEYTTSPSHNCHIASLNARKLSQIEKSGRANNSGFNKKQLTVTALYALVITRINIATFFFLEKNLSNPVRFNHFLKTELKDNRLRKQHLNKNTASQKEAQPIFKII
jgi:hypothetical protein